MSDGPLAVNQVEYHPFLSQQPILATCAGHGMAMMAYCPIAKGQVLENPVISEIGRQKGRSATQIALRWLVQQDVIAVPKSATSSRIAENIDVFSFNLTNHEMTQISALASRNGRIVVMNSLAPTWDS